MNDYIALGAGVIISVSGYLFKLNVDNLRREIDQLKTDMKNKAEASQVSKLQDDNRALCTRLGQQEVHSATISGKIDVVWQAVKDDRDDER